jgi:tripartite-type tricarboxylate transporter receptor subunit TctC
MSNRGGADRRHSAWKALLPAAGLILAGCGSAQDYSGAATGASSCYDGKTLTFVVAYGAGGLYDAFARASAPHLEEQLGATVVVDNRPGAGGLTAANEIYTGDPDGLTIGFFSGQGLAGAVIGGSAGATFDLEEFTYIARLSQDPRILVTGPDSDVATIEEVQASEGLRFASAGPGGADHIDGTVLVPILGLDARIITGYKGSAETAIAVTSGDNDLTSGTIPSRMGSMKSGDLIPVLVIGDERSDVLPDVPALLELDLDDEQRSLAEAHTRLQSVGTTIIAPPGTPEDCSNQLQDAFEASLDKPEFIETMAKLDQPVQFTPGNELKEVMMSVLDAPDGYRDLLQSAYEGQ